MIKMYQNRSHSGNTPDFWEENWEAGNFEETLRFCKSDPLRPLFEKYSKEGDLMLEGGCGLGQYLVYYSAKGRKVIGLDFAQKALKSLHNRQNQLNLCGGDVSRLPFDDATFDLYYSGGVVEHFEGGATKSLEEAKRVIKKDGILLISVPYQSPLRRILHPIKKNEWRKVEKSEFDNGIIFSDKTFFQYAYQTKEFEKMLEEAELKLIEKQGYAVIWGLYDVPVLNRVGQSEFPTVSVTKAVNENKPTDINVLIKDESTSILKRLIVGEDATVPVFGLGVKFMRWFAGNMMMYVCRRK